MILFPFESKTIIIIIVIIFWKNQTKFPSPFFFRLKMKGFFETFESERKEKIF